MQLRLILTNVTDPRSPMTLADLARSTPALVRGFAAGGEHAVALMQLGLVPGTRVEVVRAAPLGDPLEVDVAGARLALRRGPCRDVLVEPIAAGSPASAAGSSPASAAGSAPGPAP